MLFSTSGCSSSGGTGTSRRSVGQVERVAQAFAHAHRHQFEVVAQPVELGGQRMRQWRASRRA